MTDLSGIWVAIVTPFLGPTFSPAQGLGVDHAALRQLVQHLKQAEVTGLVALGSTGEPAALDDDEQNAVLDTVLDAAQGLPVIAGLAGNHVGHLHARLAHLNTLPLHAVLSPAPYYVRPSQAGLVAHFKALADASRAPLMLYDIPYRTGVQMDLDTLLTLAAHEHIIGLKDCGGSLDKTQQLIADGRLQVLSGEDALIFHNLCLGGAGAITAAAQVAPQAFMAMYQALREGQLAPARALQHQLAPLIRSLFSEPNPALVKAELARQGLVLPHLRPPLLEASAGAAQALEACMHALAAGG
ncbi:MAG: 4-hydroxy-tetrahydrodipicolinate synthase [Aquabacterium sp.]|uniref:4-hydroxy-tetrahydrodipicolinate synthase n=1 Tax=Aquabacterium sp. TaxID=1872578 RepID=UPI0025BF4D7A|nr:4-hydroxy-tetrahydrodipicolinate synthase [Aquabacterium sp.]MBI3382412.1 4-hydroxy-tetrahydrodipicolinate synthase [Aquabacterium sp.]